VVSVWWVEALAYIEPSRFFRYVNGLSGERIVDKNEYNAKLEEINRYVDQGNYAEAARVADQIDWKRVRNVRTLCLISEIYEAENRYEDSKNMLLKAYKKSPSGRAILYRLVEVTIQLRQFDEAIEYYSEYVHAAPHDPNRLILKYKIYRGRGSSVNEQIEILQEYLREEYNEKYAYELARLYQEADRISECLATCDDLVLWFHSGKYVIRALELKKRYSPLTPKQQEIYDHRFDMPDEEETIGQEKQMVETEDTSLAETIVEDTTREIANEVAKAAGVAARDEAQSEEAQPEDAQNVQGVQDEACSGGFDGTALEEPQSRIMENLASESLDGVFRAPVRDTDEEAADTAAAGLFSTVSAVESGAFGENSVMAEDAETELSQEDALQEAAPQETAEEEKPAAPVFNPGLQLNVQEDKYNTKDFQDEMFRSMREVVAGLGIRGEIDEDEAAMDALIDQSKQEQAERIDSDAAQIRMTRKLTLPELQQKADAGQLSIDDVLLSMGEKGEAVRETVTEAKAASGAIPQRSGVLSAVDEALLNMGIQRKTAQEERKNAAAAKEREETAALQEAAGLAGAQTEQEETPKTGEDTVRRPAEDVAQAVAEEVTGPAEDAAQAVAEEATGPVADAAQTAAEEVTGPAADAAQTGEEEVAGTADGETELPKHSETKAEENTSGESAGVAAYGQEQDPTFVPADADADMGALEAALEKRADAYMAGAEKDSRSEDGVNSPDTFPPEEGGEGELPNDPAADAAGEAGAGPEEDVKTAAEEAGDLGQTAWSTEEPAKDVPEDDVRIASVSRAGNEVDEQIQEAYEQAREGVLPEKPAQMSASDMSMREVMTAQTRRVPTDEIAARHGGTPLQMGEMAEEDGHGEAGGRQTESAGTPQESAGAAEAGKPASAPKQQPRMWLKRDLRGFFDGYLTVRDMDRQIAGAIEQIMAKGDDKTSRTGNVLIFGGHGCGKTTIGTAIAKAIAQERGSGYVKMAKIYAADLNRKDIAATIARIAGGVLIVEEAGDLDDMVADQLTTALEFRTDGLILILEDEQRYIHDLLMRHPRLTMKFTSQIYIPPFTAQDLVGFASLYADDRDYTLSAESAALLTQKLENMIENSDNGLSITNVLDIMDEAIARANKFSRKLFSGKKRFDSEGRIILQEKDFK